MRRCLAAALTLLVTGCGDPASMSTRPKLLVLAASSTTEVVTRLASDFPGASIQTSFGGSSALARQIEDGAPADLFISASRKWILELVRRDLLLEPRVLCTNRLVCIAPDGSALAATPPADAAALARRIASDARIAIADQGVPAGDYARESLQATGDLAALAPHFVAMADVRAVLRAVAAGDVAAGMVYATDARTAAVTTLFTFDAATHAPIEYLAAVTRRSADPALAKTLLEHLSSADAATVLRAAGFTPAEH